MSLSPAAARPRQNLALALAVALMLPVTLAAPRAAESAAFAKQQTVYGADNRRETFGLTGFQGQAARSTVAIIGVEQLRKDGQFFVISAPPLSEAQGLCPGQRFAQQPTAAYCSGALVGPRLVATAGHCISSADQASFRFVFGYRMADATRAVRRIPAADVYTATQIVARQETATADYALVRLDRAVSGRQPLRIARTDILAPGLQVYLLGHPSGLPRKIAGNASVTDNRSRTRFTTNLDTFGGNSGSPIFALPSNLLVGVLVAGEVDYVPRGSCNVVNQLPNFPGNEVGTRSTVFSAKVP